VTTIICSHFYY